MRAVKIFSLLLILTFCGAAVGDAPTADNRFPQVHKAEHWIVIGDDKEAGGCTATAIGPHALLTAQHCDVDAPDGSEIKIFVDVDGKPRYSTPTPYAIVAKKFDGSDHMILLLSGPTFQDVMPYVTAPPLQGESVLWWGNPAGVRDMLREGYVMGASPAPVPPSGADIQTLWYVDAPSIPGDSGSAVVDATDGHLVCIVTFGINDGEFMGCFALRFTPDQIAAAQAFGG